MEQLRLMTQRRQARRYRRLQLLSTIVSSSFPLSLKSQQARAAGSDDCCYEMIPTRWLANLLLIGEIALPRQFRCQMENVAKSKIRQLRHEICGTQSALPRPPERRAHRARRGSRVQMLPAQGQ